MANEILDLTAEQRRLDVMLREVYGHGIAAPRKRPNKPRRPCDRCGIPTYRPDRCIDCLGQP